MKASRLLTLFYLALLGMELSYLYLLASLLSGPVYTIVLILLLYPFAFILTRSTLPPRLRFILGVAGVILVILLVAGQRLLSSLQVGQADIFDITLLIGLCGLTWWLGHTVPRREVNYSIISFRLQVGILAMLVFSQVVGSVTPVFLFFLLAPLALLLAQWASSFSHGAAVLRSLNLRHLLLAGASVIVPSVALILLLSPEVARAIVGWLKDIFTKLSDWLVAQQQSAATPTRGLFSFSCSMRPEESTTSIAPATPPAEGTSGISPVFIWLIVFAVFLAILVLIAFTLRRKKASKKARPIEPVQFHIRVVSLDMFRSLISLFPRLFRKMWLRLTALFQRWIKRTKPPEEPLISIRALYRNLLRWAARQGIARAPAQTPLEHLELLEQKFPQQRGDLKKITEAYLLARYSQNLVSHEEFDSIKRAWQRAVAYHTPSRVKA
jgi:Domain of unknown function (DUF4129)